MDEIVVLLESFGVWQHKVHWLCSAPLTSELLQHEMPECIAADMLENLLSDGRDAPVYEKWPLLLKDAAASRLRCIWEQARAWDADLPFRRFVRELLRAAQHAPTPFPWGGSPCVVNSFAGWPVKMVTDVHLAPQKTRYQLWYHGTTHTSAYNIVTRGIDPKLSLPGFNVVTCMDAAVAFANHKAAASVRGVDFPAVLVFHVQWHEATPGVLQQRCVSSDEEAASFDTGLCAIVCCR